MKKIIKWIIIVLLSLFMIFIIFIAEESIRLYKQDESKPLIILDSTKYCVSCISPHEILDMEYYSIGFKVKISYHLDEKSTDDNKIIRIIGKDFLLFNKYRLWAWIS